MARYVALPLRLSREHALYAIIEPARQRDVFWEPAAAEMVAKRSGHYPGHVQLLADRVWEQATGPAISAEHVAAGLQQATKVWIGAASVRTSIGWHHDSWSS
jgi:hypothetical protein